MNRHDRSRRGFTLVEIMIVVLVVGILSTLATVLIGRIKEKTTRSIIENNLRQLYQAKEYYYTETGSTRISSVITLARDGYIRASLRDQVLSVQTLEARQGWHYSRVFKPDLPVYAIKGAINPTANTPSSDVIYYPADLSFAKP